MTVLWDAEPVVRDLRVLAGFLRGRRDLRVHVHVVRGKVECDQELEEQSPTRVGDSQKGLEACSSTSTD